MAFNYKPGLALAIFVSVFVTLYIAYLVRIFILSRKTGNRFSPVLYKFCLRSSYFSLFLISLMGPLAGTITKDIPFVQKDVFLALDLSASMKATDIVPTRFDKAKATLKKIINDVDQVRFGIIIFTSEAFLHTPLTSDKNALKTFIDVLNPDLIEAKGTSLSAPINLARESFINTLEGRYYNNPVSRILVLISDGEDFANTITTEVENANKNNIKILTFGIGTHEGTSILVKNKQVITRYSPKTLKSIARESDGEYFEITNTKNDTDLLIKNLKQWDFDKLMVQKNNVVSNKYFYFLLLALILMIMDVLITINIIKV